MSRSLRFLRFAVLGKIEHPRRPRRSRVGYRGPARDAQYLRWIRGLPCCCGCGQSPCDAAHTGSDGGMSVKASDYSCVPLFRRCHDRYHRIGRAAFEADFAIRFESIARNLFKMWKGVVDADTH